MRGVDYRILATSAYGVQVPWTGSCGRANGGLGQQLKVPAVGGHAGETAWTPRRFLRALVHTGYIVVSTPGTTSPRPHPPFPSAPPVSTHRTRRDLLVSDGSRPSTERTGGVPSVPDAIFPPATAPFLCWAPTLIREGRTSLPLHPFFFPPPFPKHRIPKQQAATICAFYVSVRSLNKSPA